MVTINNMYVEKQAKGIRKIVPITSVRGTGKDIKQVDQHNYKKLF